MLGVTVKLQSKAKGLEDLKRRLKELGAAKLKVGVVGEAALRQHPNSNLTIGELAVLHEFGSSDGHTPARHFVGDALRKNQRTKIANMLRIVAARVAGPDVESGDALHALDWLGKNVTEMVRQFVLGAEVRPLDADSTRAKKGPLPTLVDSMSLVDALNYQVVKTSKDVLEGGASAEDFEQFEYQDSGPDPGNRMEFPAQSGGRSYANTSPDAGDALEFPAQNRGNGPDPGDALSFPARK